MAVGRVKRSSMLLIVRLFLMLLVCNVIPPVNCQYKKTPIYIGGLFDDQDGTGLTTKAWEHSVRRVNHNEILLPKYKLESIVERLPTNNSFYASDKVCQLFRSGVLAIFGPESRTTSSHIGSICDSLEIPHIQTRFYPGTNKKQLAINLHPDLLSLSQAYKDVVTEMGWKTFTVLYDEEENLVRLQSLMAMSTIHGIKVLLRRLPKSGNYRPMFKSIGKLGNEKEFVLDCDARVIPDVLKHAQQVGMMTSQYSFFITSLDLHTINLEDFKYSGTNITGLRLVDFDKIDQLSRDYTIMDHKFNFDPNTFTTEAALAYDAVQLYARGLHSFVGGGKSYHFKSVSCDGTDTWVHGNSLSNYMKTEKMEGLTGFIVFDNGLRSFFHLSITELTPEGLQPVGTWNKNDKANFTRIVIEQPLIQDTSLANKTFIVTSILNAPYFMLKESPDRLEGNDRFEGFAKDIIDEVSKLLGFNYIFQEVGDGKHGNADPVTGEWNGMIRELMDGKADMAIADLSVSYEREQAVDFTLPFMNTGISILYKKPQKQPPSLFSFLSPLSVQVWIYMMAAYMGISLSLFLMSRITPYEWVNPHPCDPNPEELENDLNFLNSMWFTIGSLMQQGCDLAPKATSTRMVAGIWWFFTMIMISSYTANLAAFLTVERTVSPISSVEDLAKQTKIKYGSYGSGSTTSFLRASTMDIYKRMYEFMISTKPSVFTAGNMEGVVRVQKSNGDYAFMMESTSIEYFTERRCDLVQVGGMLDSKGYGIAVKSGSPYRAPLSQAILKLHEANRLLILKNRWWKEKRGGGACKDEGSSSSTKASELGLANVGGVFVVLLGGLVVASMISLCEFFWEARKQVLAEGGDFWSSIAREFRHTLMASGNTRPVVRRNGASVPPS